MNRIIFLFTIIVVSIVVLKLSSSSMYRVRAFYSIPQIDNVDISKKIIDEFSKINGIILCEASIYSRNVLLEYDKSKISYSDIEKIFYKWGCSISNVYYDNLFVYQ